MTLRFRAIKNYRPLNVPVSFKTLDQDKLYDARNIINNGGTQETRYGLTRLNTTTLGGKVLSVTYFKDVDGNRFRLAKIETNLYKVNNSGSHTLIKAGLTAANKHRAITLNNRQIIAIGDDGLFSYDGVTFAELGQAAPTGISAAIAAGGSLVDTNVYRIGVTFYSSSTGFESNAFESSSVTATAVNKQINITGIPATASNATIDKIRIYLKNVTNNGAYLFVAEQNLGTTSYTVTAPTTSTITPPTTHMPPLDGGGSYLTTFGPSLVYAGSEDFPNDVFFSEDYIPDAFDQTSTGRTLNIPGDGRITAIAQGFFDDSNLVPYLAIFKKTSTHIYSEIGGSPQFATIDSSVGCIGQDTIKIANGLIYFMSESGWRVIKRGVLIKNSKDRPFTLGDGDIDDIFTRTGWTYELNKKNFDNFFSSYYSINGQYLTFISEGVSQDITKCYVYEETIGGFRVWDFKTKISSACEGEDDDGIASVFLGSDDGFVYVYSSQNSRFDEDSAGNSVSIPAYVIFSYIAPDENMSSYNFKYMAVRAFSSQNPIRVDCYASFGSNFFDSYNYDFPLDVEPFILDQSQLDVDRLGDDRVPVTYRGDISLTGEVLLVGLYQDVVNANLGLISAQVHFNKNGNANL